MLNDKFRPLLSPIDDPKKNPNFFTKLPFPLLGSPKLDGIRSIVRDKGLAVSRSNKPLPSYQVQCDFSGIVGLDGELIAGNPTDFGVYNRTQSFVMSRDKPADLSYHVFDFIGEDWHLKPFYERLDEAERRVKGAENHFFVAHKELNCLEDLLEFENEELAKGYEGIMLRNPVGRYKNGRATYNEGIIFKLKRFSDDEGVVVDFVERMVNTNEQTRDERGYAKRSSAKDGKVPAGTLGKLIVQWNGMELEVGPGVFKHAELQDIWDNREAYLGKFVKFRYFSHGVKDLPRFPRALGWRDEIDL